MVALRLPLAPLRDEHDLFQALVQSAEGSCTDAPALVVFPGHFAAGLLDIRQSLAAAAAAEGALERLEAAYRAAGGRAARQLGTVLVPGTVLARRDDGIVELAVVFGPDGEALGEQAAVHPAWPADRGDDVFHVIRTPVGALGLLLGQDVRMPESARILSLLGAEILVAPLAPRHPYTAERAMAGLWQLVQQTQTWGVEAGLSGQGFGMDFDGKAAVFGPCEATPGETGFLGRGGYLVRDGAVVATVDAARLRETRRAYPLYRHMNPALYRRYLPDLYERARCEP